MQRQRLALLALGLLVAGTHAQSLITGAPDAPTTPGVIAPAGSPAAPAIQQPRGPCDLRLTFFPAQGESIPVGWTQPVQQAAGNTAEDQMLKIALAGYPVPQLYLAPVSVYTQVGGAVPVTCVTGQAAAGAGVLVQPAAFTVTWAVGGVGGTLGPYPKGSKQDPPANVTLNFINELPDGDYCLQVKLDLVPKTGIVAVGAQQAAVPAAAQSVMRQVCFYKLSSRPSANITFHSCNSSFAVDLTGVTPKPQLSSRPDLQLFQTVFHVWGKLNRTFDAEPPADGATDFFGQYVRWSDPAAPNYLQVYLEQPNLINGYYVVNIEGSLSSSVPDLNSLFGLDQYEDGTAKFMGVSLRNASNSLVPIQTVKSEIANLAGPETQLAAGAGAAFTWETNGYGEQFCYVDGQRVSNSADRAHCESPLTLRVADAANHTLEVVLMDVCGQTVANGLFFGSWGWRINPKYAPPAPSPQPEYTDPLVPAAPLPGLAGAGAGNGTGMRASRAAAASGAGERGAAWRAAAAGAAGAALLALAL